MGFLLRMMLTGSLAGAVLGGPPFNFQKDMAYFKARATVGHQINSCYLVNATEGDGFGIKEYIGAVSHQVFMIRYTSRGPLELKPMFSAPDFQEFQQAGSSGGRRVRTVSRNHKAATSETPRLKVHLDSGQMVHRALIISKTDVPQCAGDVEALP